MIELPDSHPRGLSANHGECPSSTRLALRPKEAAIALGIGGRLLWEKTNCGEIPCAKIGRRVVYPIELLNEYLLRQAKGVGR